MNTGKSCSLVILLIVAVALLFAGQTSAAAIVKRSFVKLGCMGEYDKADFAKLDRICVECYNLYRIMGLHAMCRDNCFKNEYFTGCVKALLLSDKQEELDNMANRLYGNA